MTLKIRTFVAKIKEDIIVRLLKPRHFKAGSATVIVCLALGRCIYNSGVTSSVDNLTLADTTVTVTEDFALKPHAPLPLITVGIVGTTSYTHKHPIYSLRGASYSKAFNDLQDTQIVAAQQWGITPVKTRGEAERRMDELVYIGSNPYYTIDPSMKRSIPYLVPRAADLLHTIATSFIDSLAVKDIPSHKIIITSCLRTEDDIKKLSRNNVNASTQSCHRYGTTIDIAYARYHTVCPPGEKRRKVSDDTLKKVLGEVLYDLRAQGRCYVKHERKQGCFHITTR